jgi:hypothetical protein
MPQEPKRPVSELKPAELRTIVGNIQKLLWLDVEARLPATGIRILDS